MLSIREYIKRPQRIATALLQRYFFWLPDKLYIKLMFRLKMGYKLNLKNPQTFSEKIQWLKLYNRKPEYTMMVDKYAVKDYVANIIGEKYIIPTIGVWDDPEEIEWEKLPNQFVLKTTHGGGSSGVVICKDKTTFDKKDAISKLKLSMKQDIYRTLKEWPYKNVPKRIIAEQYIESRPKTKEIPDYKWYCFGGEPKYCQVIQDRSTTETIDFFDIDWKHQEFVGLNPVHGLEYNTALMEPQRPLNLDTQIRIARELSKNMPFSRIDLYELEEKTYFGEITFYPMSGLGVFSPEQYNELLGEMLDLPGEKRGGVIINELQGNRLQISCPDLPDYKVFCFNGEPRMIEVDYNRFKGHLRNLYSTDWRRIDAVLKYPSDPEREFAKPEVLDELKELCRKVSAGIPHVRSDFFIIDNKIYFGELTFFHGSGYEKTTPEEFDKTIGDWLILPVNSQAAKNS